MSTRRLLDAKSGSPSARTGGKLLLPMVTETEQPAFFAFFSLRMAPLIKRAIGGSSVKIFYLYSKHELFKILTTKGSITKHRCGSYFRTNAPPLWLFDTLFLATAPLKSMLLWRKWIFSK
jgi:hypothetical protein